MAAIDIGQRWTQAQQAVDQLPSMRHWSDSARNAVYQFGLAEQANAHELEMWNLQNAYNTPAAQMQRFKDAGLNPMLVYQQGNSGNASHAPQVHVPQGEYRPDSDKIQKINAALSIVSAINDLVGQAMGVADQGMSLQMKRNDLNWSNYQNAVAAHHLLGYGQGRNAGQFGWLGSQAISSYLDPSNSDFDPTAFGLLQRLGITQFYPRQITAEANAELSRYRQDYQKYYNEHILPKISEYQQGKIDIQVIEKAMFDYQNQALEMIPAPIRGLLEPVLKYLTPVLNGLFRGRHR